jgi:hypothetical protein
MTDFYEVDFLGVETDKSGDAITLQYAVNGYTWTHVVDGGYIDTGTQIIDHIKLYYDNPQYIHNVVLTHPDQDHANGLRAVLENCSVGMLWMHRPWEHAAELLPRFETYQSVDALRRALRDAYPAVAALEEIALRRGIEIREPFQGEMIGHFLVLAPTRSRYYDALVASEKTPAAVKQDDFLKAMIEGLSRTLKAATNLVAAAWGAEYFPPDGTSSENEMSVVQFAVLNGTRILLTGDAGRDALSEALTYAPLAGMQLPGIDLFQVPHHGGRHNVSTEILDRWLGARLTALPEATKFNAICSSAAADEAHPRKSVVRAMLHRGAHFIATEGRTIRYSMGRTRGNWTGIPQATYPTEQED